MENQNSSTEQHEGIDFKKEFFRYLYHWKWFALTLVAFITIAYFYLRKSPNIYETESTIQILDPSTGIQLQKAAFVFKSSSINLDNEMSHLTSYPLVEKVCKQLHLNYSFYAKGTIQTTKILKLPVEDFQYSANLQSSQYGLYTLEFFDNEILITTNKDEQISITNFNIKNHPKLPFNLSLTDSEKNILKDKVYIIFVTSLKSSVLSYKNRISVNQVGKNSDLLTLTLKDANPNISKNILNTLINIFLNDGVTELRQVSQSTIDFINTRFDLLISELDSIESLKVAFKKQNKITDIESHATEKLKAYSISEREYFDIAAQIDLTKNIVNILNNSTDGFNQLPLNILQDNKLNTLIQDYNSTIEKYRVLQLNAGANNPSLIFNKEKLEMLNENIGISLNNYLSDLKFKGDLIKERKNAFNSDLLKYPNQEKQYRDIERQADIKESLYLFLLQKREEAAINNAITEPTVKVIEYAYTPGGPISPKPKLVYAAAVLFGLLLPFGVIFVKNILDTKIVSKDDLLKISPNIPVVAEIPIIKEKDKTLFTDPNSNNYLAESFRILASNIEFILPKKEKGRVILCTSTIKGEGKTFISTNMSLSLASVNKKVLLIGADLRNPQIHKSINLDKNQDGLSNYLYEDNHNWQSSLINGFTNHNHHRIMLSGPVPPNPTHLLKNGNIEQLIEEAREEFDYIVIDSAPTILVTDTLLLSHLADATVFVTRSDFTEKNLLNFSKELNDTKKVNNMVYVVNGVGSRKGYGYGYGYGYNYGYGYGYNYGYGYGYNSEDEDDKI